MDAEHGNGAEPGGKRSQKTFTEKPKVSKESAEKRREHRADRPTEAEIDVSQALMETYNG